MSGDVTLADGAAPDSAGGQLADRIAEEVAASRAPPGTVVASEPELMALHRAGRPVFRQAVRILEERGVAYMRRGHGGGLVVAQPNGDFAGRGLSIVIESLTDELPQLAVLPIAVDTHLFLHGARRLSLEQCQELRRLARRLDRLSDDEFLRVGAHRQLHRAIRTASGEPAAALAHRTATEYSMDLIPYSVNLMAEGKGEPWRITLETAEALVAGDVAAMFDSRRRQMEMIHASWPEWRAIDRDPRLAPNVNDPDRPEFQLGSNQAERLAREILREIRLMGWKAGERIGGGAELMARYGASTNILRQAVRTLQEHSAVEVERGRKGGLFIAVPDRVRAVSRAKAFLAQSGAIASDVRAFLVNLLLESLDNRAVISGEGLDAALGPDPEVTFAALASAIAEASRSPPLQLFVEILTPFLPAEPGPAAPRDVLLQAFAAGDRVQSRRMLLACVTPGMFDAHAR
ncbi:MAG: GntR family transcriptional regulator [Phenylobacterium sp.]|nr:GntR family transcriptional regulator [Phenylobacterium sp.]